tara:strand:+ start:436 stop:1458 length:1023 start_codon:yes stop_codon:yes gene_type:complete
MSLFDSKQEVVNIELTSYGKKKLALGKFNPSYYAFFDDDVIYDVSYANLTESANGEADDRIRKETPYLKTIYSIVGTETKLDGAGAAFNRIDQESFNNIRMYENNNLLKYGLGTSKIGEVTGSQISVSFLDGTLTNVHTTASAFVFGTKTAYDKPQTKLTTQNLDLSPEIRSLPDPSMTIPPELLDPTRIEPAVVSPVLQDNKYIFLEVDELLLAVDELNSVEDYNNFEISIYKIEINENNEEEYKKLNFKSKQEQVNEEGFLMDRAEIAAQDSRITTDDVEFYLDIQVDEEIDPVLLTSKVPRDSLGYPILDDPLIQNTFEIRRNADFSRKRDDAGDPC